MTGVLGVHVLGNFISEILLVKIKSVTDCAGLWSVYSLKFTSPVIIKNIRQMLYKIKIQSIFYRVFFEKSLSRKSSFRSTDGNLLQ